MKSEEDDVSIDDLKHMKRVAWYGVRNYQARNYMRDDMQIGDMVLFYHSNGKPSGPAGVARVVSIPYSDNTQFDSSSPYFDPKSKTLGARWVMVDVEFIEKFPKVILRESLKESPALSGLYLWSRPRLSIMPLTKTEFETILSIGRK